MLIYCYLGIPSNRTAGNPTAFDHFHGQIVTLGMCLAGSAVLHTAGIAAAALPWNGWVCIFQLLLCLKDSLCGTLSISKVPFLNHAVIYVLKVNSRTGPVKVRVMLHLGNIKSKLMLTLRVNAYLCPY